MPRSLSCALLFSASLVSGCANNEPTKLSCRTVNNEPRMLTIAYPEGAEVPLVAFDKAGPASDSLYPPAGLGLSSDMVKLPKGKGPKGVAGPLWVDRTEVTVDAYRECVLAKKCEAPLSKG